ncbi:hypothetical protein C8A03DRAFT_14755, partial [Achaetomium macrosporum]
MPQSSAIHLHLLLAACWVTTAKADGWDDFANNLATDLAPLVALFGEQATKQFLSESTTTLDNFIFAMAPLGILTAVVSAIRVCGGPSLRAFIGRAQEGGGIAEAELCSSTSRDVCELYHNGAIVRVFGRPKILEVVHVREAAVPDDSDGKTPPEYGIYSFREYIKKESFRNVGWEEDGKRESLKRKLGDDEALTEAETGKDVEDEFAPNPNLSFNIGIREQPRYVIWLAATVGFIAQASVLVFGFLVTYPLAWPKDEGLPPAWAFPLMSVGTILLCGGMFSCAFLVERSTKERVFRRPSGRSESFTFYVVQPGNQIIGDQTFDSFCFTDASRSLNKYTTSWKVHQQSELGVWLALGITMSGFVLQFVGLRAMHSAVSVLQLGAILLMSIIRAGLRTQRLGKEQNLLRRRPDEVEGHELDWLALQMAKESPWEEERGRKFWSVIAGSPELHSLPHHREPNHDTDSRQTNDAQTPKRHPAQAVFFYRSRLAELTSQPAGVKSRLSTAWDERLVYVRQQARQLKKAIESSAAVLFAHAKVQSALKSGDSIPWTINVAEYKRSDTSPSGREASQIDLSLHRPKGNKQPVVWEANQQYLEAAIGLWAWSIISDPNREEDDKFGLRVSTASEVPTSRIMAVGAAQEDIERANVELRLWIEDF